MIITHPNARSRSLDDLIADFLADLAHSNRSVHTRRAYAADLARFSSLYRGAVEDITADVLRALFATRPPQPGHQGAHSGGAGQLLRLGLSSRTHRDRADGTGRARPPRSSTARGLKREQIERVLAVIPPREPRDRLLFRLLAETGLRIGEALRLYIEDLDLTPDDEHLSVLGKGKVVQRAENAPARP